jgi:hypothetical protein
MMLHAYQAITLLVALLVAAVVLRSPSRGQQATGALVLVPLILRILLVK